MTDPPRFHFWCEMHFYRIDRFNGNSRQKKKEGVIIALARQLQKQSADIIQAESSSIILFERLTPAVNEVLKKG